MKKFFNRVKRPVQNWEDCDESDFDWDGLEQSTEEEICYEEGAADAESAEVPGEYDDAVYEETGHIEEPEYTAETGYTKEPKYREEIKYTEEPGYAEEIEYTEEPGYREETEYTEEPGYAEEPEYREEIEYTEEPGYTEGTQYTEGTEYREEPGYTEESEYTEEPGYTGETKYAEEIEYGEEYEEIYATVPEEAAAYQETEEPVENVSSGVNEEYDGAPENPVYEELPESGEYDWQEEMEGDLAADDGGEEMDEESAESAYSFEKQARNVRSPKKDRNVRGGKSSGKFWNRLAHAGAMDKLILGAGAAVLIFAVITGGVYLFSRMKMRQISAFSSIGTQLDHIDLIGETGLLAVADAQLAKMEAADIVSDNQQEQEGGEDQTPDYQEEEYKRDVHVVMEFVSIQKDLKIKFVNEKTGKLVANVPFAVNVTGPDGKKLFWSDDDMDGVIYKKDIAAGNYTVTMETLTDERYAGFTVSSGSRTAEVKKEIAYEKVEVANEIKSEDEVNAGQEDTRKNETQVESTLQDTVAWVESSVIEAVYSEVPKSSIPNPMTYALDKHFLRSAQTTSSSDAGRLAVSLAPGTVTVAAGGKVYSQADVSNAVSGKAIRYSVTPSESSYAKAGIDNTGKITITGVAPGTTQFTVKANYENGDPATEGSAVLTVTVTQAPVLTLDKAAATAYVEEPLILNAAAAGITSPGIKAVSQDDSVASVSVSGTTVTVMGKKTGTVNITVSLADNEIVKAVCVVTVKENPKTDKVSLLKDASGQQLYVQEEGEYREAVFADYYVETNKFYLRAEERYTGWQTLDGKVYYFTATGEKVVGEQVIQGAKYQFASDGSLVTGTGTLGIDVSKWNSDIDWNAVKKSGVSYVIIRCGYRGSSAGSLIEDPRFAANIKGATAVGLKVGVYFFTQAIDEREAVEEASMVLELVKNYTISYPIFLDVEASGGRADHIDKATRTAVCRAFCQTIKNAHYTAGIYANKNWLENKIDAAALNEYKIWLAQYAEKPTYTGRYDMWQYRSNGTVGGIKGSVDMNLSYLGY